MGNGNTFGDNSNDIRESLFRIDSSDFSIRSNIININDVDNIVGDIINI